VLEEFDNPPERRVRKKRWGRRILAALLALIFLGVATVGAYVLYLNHTVTSNIKHEALLPSDEGGAGGAGPSIPAHAGENYLIIGSDARPGETVGRSDVIIIAHIPEDKKQVQLIHFPRDLYVTIPGRGKDKINAAFAYGGAPLLVRTLEGMLGIKIDHVAKTGFEGFKSMTDALGGIRVWAEEPSLNIVKGWNNLDGAMALAFVRERYSLSQGDISRGHRQMAFLKALLQKATSAETLSNPITIAKFTNAATQDLIVDNGFTIAKMRSEALALRNLRSRDIIFITAPFSGFGTSPVGGSIDIVDEAGMKRLGDALRNDQMSTYTDTMLIP
jgi:LCP family protein required for cell wall assembly